MHHMRDLVASHVFNKFPLGIPQIIRVTMEVGMGATMGTLMVSLPI